MRKTCTIRKGDTVKTVTLVQWSSGKLMAFPHQTDDEAEQKKFPAPIMFDSDGGNGENGWEIEF